MSAEALRGGGGADSFVQFPLEKGSRKVYDYSTLLKSKNRPEFIEGRFLLSVSVLILP